MLFFCNHGNNVCVQNILRYLISFRNWPTYFPVLFPYYTGTDHVITAGREYGSRN